MKKILKSSALVLAVAVIAGIATYSYFSDTETSTGNTFTAGAIDLKVDSKCTYNGVEQLGCTWLTPKDLAAGDLFFNYNDVKPGDTGEDTISLHVDNNDAYVCAAISNLKNEENNCNNPEKIAEPNCEADNIGELQNNLLFTVWKDTDCDNVLDTGTQGTPGYCTSNLNPDYAAFCKSHLTEQQGCELDELCYWINGIPAVPAEQILVTDQPATNGIWPIADSSTGGSLAGDTTACIGVSWRIPGNIGNEIQTDKLTADISFDAIQARNLPQYYCVPQGGCVPQTEMCNGKDDDCDGLIDEDWQLGGECSAGGGACYATGTYVCNPASPAGDAICSATAGQPSAELCTGGADEDCDGSIDCGDSDCTNDQVCQVPTDTTTLRLENKDGGWHAITNDNIFGDLTYNPSGPTFDYSFVGRTQTPGNYNLIYYPDPWGSPKTVVLIGGTIVTDPSGNFNTGNQSVELGMDLPNSTPSFDSNYPAGAKFWLVPSFTLSGNHLTWPGTTANFLLEMGWVNYDDTDVVSPETIALTDLGASSQYGYYHNYAGANVSFQYTTPASGKLTGTITATSLKPYATYQLKFEGKPVCKYGAAGDDAENEQIGYMGRWWDNTTNSNTNDAGYLANSIYHGGTHCISSYIVWGYITADASGTATKVVTTDSSYHVLWCSGGTCGQSNNSQLAFLDPAYPALNLCSAGNVNGEIERGTCGGMTFASGTYKLGMILNEESFHMGPGTWTAVMGRDIEFIIN